MKYILKTHGERWRALTSLLEERWQLFFWNFFQVELLGACLLRGFQPHPWSLVGRIDMADVAAVLLQDGVQTRSGALDPDVHSLELSAFLETIDLK